MAVFMKEVIYQSTENDEIQEEKPSGPFSATFGGFSKEAKPPVGPGESKLKPFGSSGFGFGGSSGAPSS
jgi:hypothetical protein